MYFINEDKHVVYETVLGGYQYYNPLKMCNLVSETDTQKVFQWQIFEADEQKYIDDTTNNTVINIDGTDYTPTNGQVIILKG
ncbi:hypothetical protein [Dehalobacter restrictus]|uniref:Uncharacterized protein n=1 Tax=Dehalobacter restrictus TaxID=55583 RepID=A0A857DDW8_9FIRM|nr:hypothetical protein [Dehalobacter restrictus]QGZ99439.1 hypothetical protein GQ588_01535 [Dehalobacter restrictus]